MSINECAFVQYVVSNSIWKSHGFVSVCRAVFVCCVTGTGCRRTRRRKGWGGRTVWTRRLLTFEHGTPTLCGRWHVTSKHLLLLTEQFYVVRQVNTWLTLQLCLRFTAQLSQRHFVVFCQLLTLYVSMLIFHIYLITIKPCSSSAVKFSNFCPIFFAFVYVIFLIWVISWVFLSL